MGWRQFRGGRGRPPPAWTPLRPLRQLQRAQARRHDGRRRPVQVRRGRVCRVVASRGKRGLLPAASASPAHVLPVPRQRQSKIPRSSGVPEDKVVGVSEVPPCGRLRPVLQVRGLKTVWYKTTVRGFVRDTGCTSCCPSMKSVISSCSL